MAKEKEELIVDVEGALSKTEQYIEDNQQNLITLAVILIALVGGYFAYTRVYVAGEEEAARSEMFRAEQYFASNQFDKAINGEDVNGTYAMGFEEITETYGMTPSGNLAEYYLGISFLKTGQYEDAIDHLNSFDGSDQIVAPLATGAIGDAYLELGKTDEAITYYLKAADQSNNKFTTPIFLKKAGLANEDKASYPVAVQLYERIKNEFPETVEGREMAKYISRAKVLGDIK